MGLTQLTVTGGKFAGSGLAGESVSAPTPEEATSVAADQGSLEMATVAGVCTPRVCCACLVW